LSEGRSLLKRSPAHAGWTDEKARSRMVAHPAGSADRKRADGVRAGNGNPAPERTPTSGLKKVRKSLVDPVMYSLRVVQEDGDDEGGAAVGGAGLMGEDPKDERRTVGGTTAGRSISANARSRTASVPLSSGGALRRSLSRGRVSRRCLRVSRGGGPRSSPPRRRCRGSPAAGR
jgi:hypothetical protein